MVDTLITLGALGIVILLWMTIAFLAVYLYLWIREEIEFGKK